MYLECICVLFFSDEIYEQTQQIIDDSDNNMNEADEELSQLDEDLREKFLNILENLDENPRLYDALNQEQELPQQRLDEDYYPQEDMNELENRLMAEYAYRYVIEWNYSSKSGYRHVFKLFSYN